MSSSWLSRGRRSPGTNFMTGAVLIAVGLWDLFRSADVIFSVLGVVFILLGGLNIARGIVQQRRAGSLHRDLAGDRHRKNH